MEKRGGGVGQKQDGLVVEMCVGDMCKGVTGSEVIGRLMFDRWSARCFHSPALLFIYSNGRAGCKHSPRTPHAAAANNDSEERMIHSSKARCVVERLFVFSHVVDTTGERTAAAALLPLRTLHILCDDSMGHSRRHSPSGTS